jgi:nucleotide-binding universal stress UspA family protein
VKILVCIDGEPHSKSAVRRAIFLSLSLSAELSALYVIDPWLKKFYNELYSQGRKRYLEYVDECLRAQAEQVQKEFKEMCLAQGLQARFKTRHGEPMAEILEELHDFNPSLLITGSKLLSAWGRFRSRNLPLLLRKRVSRDVSMISIVEK